MRKRNPTTRQRLRRLDARRARVLATLLDTAVLLKGSVSRVKRTCGKAACHCAERPGHLVWVLATSAGPARRCQVIRQADVAVVRERVARYREFRAALRQLEAIHKEHKALLRGLMEDRNVPYE